MQHGLDGWGASIHYFVQTRDPCYLWSATVGTAYGIAETSEANLIATP